MNGKEPRPPANNGNNGARISGKDPGLHGGPPSPGSEPAGSRNGLPDSRSEPLGSRSEPQVPAGNGTNGSAPRSSLFRPGAFASMPVLRIPPKAAGPAQPPPTQIPMEVYSRPDTERITPAKNETPSSGPLSQKLPRTSAPGLDQLLKQNVNLPAQAAVLGVCDDGLPVLLDLYDPVPGALVVIGDEREAQLQMLRTAVASLVGRNSPRSVQFIVFSCEPDQWQNWAKEKGYDRHCLAVENADAETVRDWIVRLADWTEQRRLGQSSGPSVVLVMDTLSFLPNLEYDIRLNFDWMAKEGPAAQIWPLAAISTDLAKALSGRRMLRSFQTRVMGFANQAADYVPLAGLEPQAAEAFGRRGEFMVKTGETWLRFRLPGR